MEKSEDKKSEQQQKTQSEVKQETKQDEKSLIKSEKESEKQDQTVQNEESKQVEEQEEQDLQEQQDNQEQQQQGYSYEQTLSPRFYIREATHAGSWYTKYEHELDVQLNAWIDLARCEISNVDTIKAIIAPHSGFSLSGPTAAWPYKYLKVHQTKQEKMKVFLLGPAHYCFLRACCLTTLHTYKTPFGDIKIDQKTIKELHDNPDIEFEETDKDADEEEFSLEMQLPFLVKILGLQNFELIPMLVGSLDEKQEEKVAKVLQPYFEQENTLFIISTDFCHWGKKYKYTFTGKDPNGEIFENIEKLDQKAMELIELHDVDGFSNYCKETGNTICGKHIISILLRLFLNSKEQEIETKFLKYSMGHLVKDQSENSISYAAAVSYTEQQQ